MKQFRNTESYLSTGSLSVELKNLSNSERGLWAEKIVHDFLISKKWKLVSHREKYLHGEIDFIFKRDQKIAIIEVKYLHDSWMSFQRISNQQVLRLQNNFLNLSKIQFKSFHVKLFLCFVDLNQRIEWIELS